MKRLKFKKLAIVIVTLAAFALCAGPALANLIVNGDFETITQLPPGTTGYDYWPANTTSMGEQKYTIDDNPKDNHTSWASYSPPGNNNTMMLIVNGTRTANVVVWSQQVSVSFDTPYHFSAWVASSYPTNPAILELRINNTPIASFTASSTTGFWQEFPVNWTSTTNGSVTLALVETSLKFDGNDFTLDNLSFNAVPIPAAAWLLGTGLIGLVVIRRRMKK